MYQVGIVGGGTAGLYLSYLLAKQGIENVVFEEHGEIGKPLDCSGLLGSITFKEFDIDKSIIKKEIKKAYLEGAEGESIEFGEGQIITYLIDREEIEKNFAEKAKDEGAVIKTGTPINSFKNKGDHFELKSNEKKFKSKILVGADGAISIIGGGANLTDNQEYVKGLEYVFKEENEGKGNFRVYLDPKYSKKRYAWKINGEKTRIGIIDKANVKSKLDEFVKELGHNPEEGRLIGKFMPTELLDKFTKGKLALVGDAAGQIFPFVGGGIRLGIWGASILAEKIERYFETGDLRLLKDYRKSFKKELWKEFIIGDCLKGSYPRTWKNRKVLFEFAKEHQKVLSKHLKMDSYYPMYRNLDFKTKLDTLFLYLKLRI